MEGSGIHGEGGKGTWGGIADSPGLFLYVFEQVLWVFQLLHFLTSKDTGSKDDGQVARAHLVDVIVLSNPKHK